MSKALLTKSLAYVRSGRSEKKNAGSQIGEERVEEVGTKRDTNLKSKRGSTRLEKPMTRKSIT